jgi:hypothetical protein
MLQWISKRSSYGYKILDYVVKTDKIYVVENGQNKIGLIHTLLDEKGVCN